MRGHHLRSDVVCGHVQMTLLTIQQADTLDLPAIVPFLLSRAGPTTCHQRHRSEVIHFIYAVMRVLALFSSICFFNGEIKLVIVGSTIPSGWVIKVGEIKLDSSGFLIHDCESLENPIH